MNILQTSPEFVKEANAALDQSTAQLPYKPLIQQLLAQRVDPPNRNEADEASDKKLRDSIGKRIAQQDTTTGGGSSQ